MKILTSIVLGLVGILAIVAIVFIVLGPERFWKFFGEADLGPVSFEQFQRRASPNDALACPIGSCSAPADITTKTYPVSARDLRAAFAKVIASEPRVTTAETNEAALTDRYIQRSERLGFPDTIVVRFFDRPGGQSTLAIYSRSQIGESDFGVNKARAERWLAKLAEEISPLD
jgi:uncharacterized protein (DUF1499 family)